MNGENRMEVLTKLDRIMLPVIAFVCSVLAICTFLVRVFSSKRSKKEAMDKAFEPDHKKCRS